MRTWPTRVGTVLQLMDPTVAPKLLLDRLWMEVARWSTIGGLWLQTRPGHLAPSGTYIVGEPPADAEEIAALATNATAPIATDGLPVVARQLHDGNVPIATLMVSHSGCEDAAAFLVDVLARWCTDRLRLQLEASELAEENQALRGALTAPLRSNDILTNNGAMEALLQSAARCAASGATVLIGGETGTGKELIARHIHAQSRRAHLPLVAFNAGMLAPELVECELFGLARGVGGGSERKGLIEIADGGTLLIDGVAEISDVVQTRLLRLLQERTLTRVGSTTARAVDVRIIAATHRDLAAQMRAGRFREELFYRLNIVALQVPPLRERCEDIPLLLNHFLQKYNRENFKQVDEVPRPVLEALTAYPWPGNVRELENCVQKAVVLAPGTVFLEDLVPPTVRAYVAAPKPVSPPIPADEALAAAVVRYAAASGANLEAAFAIVERALIRHAVASERGVKLRTATALGINRVTLDRKLDHYGIGVRRGTGLVEAG